jgi:hypothetical protein
LTSLGTGLLSKIISSLIIRFKPNVRGALTAKTMRGLLMPDVKEWAKLRILPAGDSIRTSGGASSGGLDAEDGRDNTIVRVGDLLFYH